MALNSTVTRSNWNLEMLVLLKTTKKNVKTLTFDSFRTVAKGFTH